MLRPSTVRELRKVMYGRHYSNPAYYDKDRSTGAWAHYGHNTDAIARGEDRVHSWSVGEKGEPAQAKFISEKVLKPADAVSVGPNGKRVVARFRLSEKDGKLQFGRDKYRFDPNAKSYLVEVPLPVGGPVQNVVNWARLHLTEPKVLVECDPDAPFDIGSDGELVMAKDNRVVKVEGKKVKPWIAFDEPVTDLEFLSDGTLAVETQPENFRCKHHHAVVKGQNAPVALPKIHFSGCPTEEAGE